MSWRVAVSTGAWIGQDVGESLATFAAAGFEALEVGTPPGHFDPWQNDQVRALAQRLRTAGMAAVSIHAPFGGMLDLSDPNAHHRHAAIGGIIASASALHELGGAIVVAHPSDIPRDGQDVAQRLADCGSALAMLTRSCRQMGMTLAIETPLPHLIGGHPEEFRRILDAVGPLARVCLDTSHATLGHHWEQFMELAGDRIVHVHANDHHGTSDEHLAPGDGIVPWQRIGAALAALRFSGWLVLELNRELSSSPTELVRARTQLLSALGEPSLGTVTADRPA